MNRSNRFLSLLYSALLAFCCIASAGVAAQSPPQAGQTARTTPQQGMPQPPDWERLPSAQRDALIAVVRERWDAEPGQRARMLQHAERWQRMTPEQRRSAQRGKQRWEQMSPEQRKQARTKFEMGRDLPPEARSRLREKLKAMTPEQRREWIRTHRRGQGREGRSKAPGPTP